MKLSVEGYKSIASKRELDFAGLTVLAGANSSGKSSFMQPFLILKQTIENHYDSGALVLDGENVRLTESSQVISKVPGYDQTAFSVGMTDDSSTCTVTYQRQPTGLVVDSVEFQRNSMRESATLSIGMTSEEIAQTVINYEVESFKNMNYLLGTSIEWSATKGKCFITVKIKLPTRDPVSIPDASPTINLNHLITRLIHVPGLRGNPERTYKITASDEVYPGSFEKYIASIIARWSESDQDKFNTLNTQLNQLGLAKSIQASVINETNIAIEVSRTKSTTTASTKSNKSDCVNIADVGFGVSQTIPVLVALICAKPDQLVYIEQPELHLHPKAQFKLADIIAKAAVRGVKVVIETHSSILLRGIQIAVVKKTINPELVSLNWFTQDDTSGETNVDKAELDQYGAFGEWPEDFDDTSLSVEQMYLDAVEEAISGE
ncbi:MAG: putative ATPase [Phenylobacterium sp.]|jgi:predicted ATPase